MSMTTLEMAMNLWSISDKSQKLNLMRKFLAKHGELTSKNDFIGFLIGEYDSEHQCNAVKLNIVERDG